MGRKWQAKDEIYFRYPSCIPFLSMWYFPNVLVAKLSRHLSLDNSLKLYVYFILLHYLLSSFIAYKVMGLFGALTLTYAGYCIKPNTPSFVYTMTWMPGMLIGGWFGAFSCFMAITGGYWPILVYFMPVAAIVNPWCLLGVIPALVQIIPFAWYWPKSVRAKEKVDPKFGRLPWWKLKDLFIPSQSVGVTNGVHYPEVEMYMGIAVLFIWHVSWWWTVITMSMLVAIGLLRPVQRIPARAVYLLILGIAMVCLLPQDIQLVMTVLQGWLLLRNSSIYPSFPFSQWWNKPSILYAKSAKAYNWPFNTGYLQGKKTGDYYSGAFSLKCQTMT